jgi:hypothetical protein
MVNNCQKHSRTSQKALSKIVKQMFPIHNTGLLHMHVHFTCKNTWRGEMLGKCLSKKSTLETTYNSVVSLGSRLFSA